MSSRKKQQRQQQREVKVKVFQPKEVKPQSQNQLQYIKAIRGSTITFCLGLPGTGKTYLAVSEAVKNLNDNKVERIVITRPIVEAGERLGFLPGKPEDKIHPYLQPIFDSLRDFYSYSQLAELKNGRTLEICPLAYMRGRTFKNAFIILDEAQNSTLAQMKMLLTRIGLGSKMVICGDTDQSDIDGNDLRICADRLNGIDGISLVELDRTDVVRHPIIDKILDKLGERNGHRGHNGNGHNRIRDLVV